MYEKLLEKLKQNQPLIHCITNPIAIHQSANAVLALGARPIMAEHPEEVSEITGTAQGLLMNLGNITDVRMESMKRSFGTAREEKLPVVLDAVGVACSTLRRRFVQELLEAGAPTVIKGNYSEILALHRLEYRSSGVDADRSLTTDSVTAAAVSLAEKYHTLILASGKTDIVTDGKRVVYVHNGSARLSTVTGTGCMLGAICTCCIALESSLDAVVKACTILGICGERAKTEKGSGSFMVNLMDALSLINDKDIEDCQKVEEQKYGGI